MAETIVKPEVASGILAAILAGFIAAVWLAGYVKQREFLKPTSDLVAAFRTQKWWSLACSFFAAAFGASALVANPEAGVTGGLLQVFAYGLANGLPYFVLAVVGPQIQTYLGDNGGFTIADFVLKRYGFLMFIPTVILSLGFLFIWLTAELTSIADSFSLLSPDFYTPAAPITVGFGVAVYALFAGFRGSIFTDRIQAAMAIVATLILVIAVFNHVPAEDSWWNMARVSTQDGLQGALVLILSTTLNQFLDLGSWQRVFASEDHREARIGLVVAGGVNFICQSLMTLMGCYAVGAGISGAISLPPGDEALGFYKMLGCLPIGYNIIALIFVIVLSISTVDSIENSLAAALAHIVVKREHSLNWCRLLSLALIGLSVALATTKQSVLSLFLLSNIFSSCIVPPIFLGLSKKHSSTVGALAGFVSGVILIFVIGWCSERSFSAAMKWPMFPNGFSHYTTLITFVACPSFSAAITLIVSSFWPDPEIESIQSTQEDPESELATKLHKTILKTNWADTAALVLDVPFWRDIHKDLSKEAVRTPQFASSSEWTKLQDLMTLMYKCEETRDYINQILELLARDSHCAPATEPNVIMDDTVQELIDIWQKLIKHPTYSAKVDESVGKGLRLLRQRYRFNWPDDHKAYY